MPCFRGCVDGLCLWLFCQRKSSKLQALSSSTKVLRFSLAGLFRPVSRSIQWLQGWSIHAARAKESCSGFPSAACQILPGWLRGSLGKFPGEGGGEEAGAKFPFPTFTATSPATSAASLLRVERSPLPVGEFILQSAL